MITVLLDGRRYIFAEADAFNVNGEYLEVWKEEDLVAEFKEWDGVWDVTSLDAPSIQSV